MVALHRRHRQGQAGLALKYAAPLIKAIRAMSARVLKKVQSFAKTVRDAHTLFRDADFEDIDDELDDFLTDDLIVFEELATELVPQVIARGKQLGFEWVEQDAKQVAGIDVGKVVKSDPRLRKVESDSLRDNVKLIKSIPVDFHDRVRERIKQAFENGELSGSMRDEFASMLRDLPEYAGIAERHAKLIARDQAAKITSQFNHARLQNLGADSYIWSTSQDERVRESHAEMEGVKCAFDDPPIVDDEAVNPGEAIQCRCVALPIFADLETAD